MRKTQIMGHGDVIGEKLSPAQMAANEQMRKVLEEDCYSALGSIVESDSEDETLEYRGRSVARLDRAAVLSAMRKRLWMERAGGNAVVTSQDDNEEEDDGDDNESRSSRVPRKKKRRKARRPREEESSLPGTDSDAGSVAAASDIMSIEEPRLVDTERDESSIFGATVGSSNATWVECDKCKKVRNCWRIVALVSECFGV